LGDGEEECGGGVGHNYGEALAVVELRVGHDHFSRAECKACLDR
jgi:hypothetical protein